MPRETLTRDQIVRAAIELLDAEGLDGLNMRTLGKRLDSAATAVYWHVKNKDDLVVLAADAVFGEIELPDPHVAGWRAAAEAMATSTHAMLGRHLWLVPAMGTHLVYGPRKARHDDHALSIYEAAGFPGPAAEAALTTVFTFVLGHALGAAADHAWRTRLRRAGDEEEQMRAAMAAVTSVAEKFPRLRAGLGREDPTATPDDAFVFGLEAILDGLAARLTRSTHPAH